MNCVQKIKVADEDEGIRLDRWFKRWFPDIAHGRLQKWLRTGQVRVDAGRAKSSTRVYPGQTIRIPPMGGVSEQGREPTRKAFEISAKDAAAMRNLVLHKDDQVIALNKPAGLAVQGGSGTRRHVDGFLEALRFGSGKRPCLVHRLDKDTSGVLLLARTAAVARQLTASFKSKDAQKLYWAIVVGAPRPQHGVIDLGVAKLPGMRGERMVPNTKEGKRALTNYRVLDKVGRKAAWVAFEPLTGRTHQIRVHAAEALETPILGDGKYGGREAFIDGEGIARQLHLHARVLRLPHPDGGIFECVAPLPTHMKATLQALGLSVQPEYDKFMQLDVIG